MSPQVATLICERIALGESLRAICRDKDMPDPAVFCRTVLKDENLRQQYASAREIQSEILVDEIIAIADKATPETANAARLQVDSRKWFASKVLPKKYGDKAGDVNVLNQTNNIVVLPEAERKELMAKHEAMLTAIEQKRLEQ